MNIMEVDANDSTTLGEDAAAVWLLVSSDPRVLVPRSDLSSRSGLESSAFDVAAGDLQQAGLVDVSQLDIPYLTLSPFAAESLGLRIGTSVRGVSSLVWVRAGARAPRERSRSIKRSRVRDYSAEICSTDSDPLDHIAAVEAVEHYLDRVLADVTGRPLIKDGFPRPSVLLTGCRSWSSDPIDRDAECPSCRRSGLEPVGVSAYCLRCDRWGLDWILARLATRAKKGPTAAKRSTPSASGCP